MIPVDGKSRKWFFLAGAIFLAFLIWYFRSLVGYMVISLVLSMVGRPVVRFLTRVRIRSFRISQGVAAFLTLLLFWVAFVGAFRFLIPTLVGEFQELSTINPESVFTVIDEPLDRLMSAIGQAPVGSSQALFSDLFETQLRERLGLEQLSNLVGVLAGALGELLIGFFSVSFITFFFLKEETMFREAVLMLVPVEHEERVERVLDSSRVLLRRYFIGLMAEVVLVGLLVFIGLLIVGLGFSHAVVIGLVCGVLNIIPYLGPWMGAAVGLLIGMALNVHAGFTAHTLPLLGLMAVVFATVQIIDNIIFQPLIYSSSVKAHPLEIFLVIMAAGGFAGIVGMILAIPVYTVLRVVAKEFFDGMKLVKKITQSM